MRKEKLKENKSYFILFLAEVIFHPTRKAWIYLTSNNLQITQTEENTAQMIIFDV